MTQSRPPRVSVIMAVYNCDSYVGKAIESVQAQTVTDWELLCVDDCSSDRSAEIVGEYAEQDRRVVLVENASNIGAPGTRNVALSHARGEFVAILDSDDVASPDRLELSLAAFERDPGLGVVAGMWDVIDSRDCVIATPRGGALCDEAIRESLLYERNRIAHSSAMIRRELMERIGGYDVELPAAQDYDLFLRLLPHCRFLRLGERLLSYRYREGAISQVNALAQRLYAEFARDRAQARLLSKPFEEQRELEVIAELLSPDHRRSRRAARHLNDAALVALYWGQPRHARELLRSARRYWPAFPRTFLSSAMTYLPQHVVSWLGDARKMVLGRRA
ncbi:MAG: glycosyltransferase [candidate division WS1 bacterium]|nr:glycosyltransferase [candidate division WS1 bacterium]